MGASQHETYILKNDIDHMTNVSASQHEPFIVKEYIDHMSNVGASQHKTFVTKVVIKYRVEVPIFQKFSQIIPAHIYIFLYI